MSHAKDPDALLTKMVNTAMMNTGCAFSIKYSVENPSLTNWKEHLALGQLFTKKSLVIVKSPPYVETVLSIKQIKMIDTIEERLEKMIRLDLIEDIEKNKSIKGYADRLLKHQSKRGSLPYNSCAELLIYSRSL
jgi:hypothetical protein